MERAAGTLTRISPFLISFAVTCAFFINFCSWIFQCGCRSLWAGADMACNIHAMHGRHCPWCSHGHAGEAMIMLGLCAPQLAVVMFTRWSWMARTLAAIGMFPAAGSAIALIFGWIDSYWRP
jgi:hypothetical protein